MTRVVNRIMSLINLGWFITYFSVFKDEYDGDRLHGQRFPTAKYMPTEPSQPPEVSQMSHVDSTGGDMFVSIEERERLMRAPLDSVRSDKRIRTHTI